jgi:hypothetical protein
MPSVDSLYVIFIVLSTSRSRVCLGYTIEQLVYPMFICRSLITNVHSPYSRLKPFNVAIDVFYNFWLVPASAAATFLTDVVITTSLCLYFGLEAQQHALSAPSYLFWSYRWHTDTS